VNDYRRSLIIFVLVLSAGLVADLGTKHWAFHSLGMPGTYRWEDAPELNAVYWLSQGIAGFQTSLNQGALFGMGQGKVFWLVVFSLVFLTGIVAFVLYSAWKSRFLVIVLGLIAAGISGNLYDRLGWHGLTDPAGEPIYAVRDWILVMIGTYPWPNFNIADAMLVCGAVLLILYQQRTSEASSKQ
jgi:signal peptidase II